MPGDDLTQQLADIIDKADDDWYDLVTGGREGEWKLDMARAVLASGLVIPTSDVVNLAQHWEDDTAAEAEVESAHHHWQKADCAAELRALTQQETP